MIKQGVGIYRYTGTMVSLLVILFIIASITLNEAAKKAVVEDPKFCEVCVSNLEKIGNIHRYMYIYIHIHNIYTNIWTFISMHICIHKYVYKYIPINLNVDALIPANKKRDKDAIEKAIFTR